MNTEEKAKAYDEVFERVKPLYEWAKKDDNPMWSTYEYLFPQLAESEDERMMREFNDWLCEEIECRTNDLRDEKDRRTLNMLCYVLTKVKNWLEKQKEPHFTKRNALFDKCVENCDPKTVEEVNKRVDDIMNMPELSAFEQALTNFIGYWEDDEEKWPSKFVKKHGKHILDMAREELQKEQKPFNDTQEYLKGMDRVQNYKELTKFEKGFDRIADTYAHRKNKDGYNQPWYTKERAAEMLYWAKEELGLLDEQKPAQTDDEREYVKTLKGLVSDFVRDSQGGITDVGYYQRMCDWLDGRHIEQKPILEVFGFKVGDAVRLKDGDGRKHIIKSFEEVEGLHGPNFYHVEFEDNSARSGIYTGEEYPNGYYTQMEKFEEEQKPAEYLDKDMVYSIMKKLHDLAFSQLIPIDSEEYKKIGEITSEVRSLLDYPIEQKPAEWSEEDNIGWDEAFACVTKTERAAKDEEELQNAVTAEKWLKEIKFKYCVHPVKQEWSEEDEKDMAHIIRILDDCYAYGKHDLSKTDHENLLGALKSLRPSWKPSEAQMKALRLARSFVVDDFSEKPTLLETLKELEEQLQKLM